MKIDMTVKELGIVDDEIFAMIKDVAELAMPGRESILDAIREGAKEATTEHLRRTNPVL